MGLNIGGHMKVTAAELVQELHDIGSLSQIFDELYWEGGYKSSVVENFVFAYAKDCGYEIKDVDNLAAELYISWQCTEKGLS